ncbi:conserved hypothetical protein [Pyrobaculum islandicum DSM 4184]|uniref:ArnR1-like winged helix-turn-helix domain-containing protein n=1 Tax=Pyrobaculum islandicum (strain DSM 4184 / JCM 9189 / GEO3) TaxID=384616 RepID=A1RU27_PYRIL|nr:winged helix-turn-helix domain-containing protein [Pyrobaculum islandicum]ABL88459.1 conserved hypothetical protein [Pyrobaculum islandicum DSM 4184]
MNEIQRLILEAIANDAEPEEIAEMFNLEFHDVQAVLESLEAQGLAKKIRTLFGTKYTLTEKGLELLGGDRPVKSLERLLPLALIGLGFTALTVALKLLIGKQTPR